MKLNRQAGCNRESCHDIRQSLQEYRKGERYRAPQLTDEERDLRVERMAELVAQDRLPTTGEDLPANWDDAITPEDPVSAAGDEFGIGSLRGAWKAKTPNIKGQIRVVRCPRKRRIRSAFLRRIRKNRNTLAQRMQAARRHGNNETARLLRRLWDRFGYGFSAPTHRLSIVAILKLGAQSPRSQSRLYLRAARAMEMEGQIDHN